MAQYVRVPAGAGRRIVRRVSTFAFHQDLSAQRPVSDDKSRAYGADVEDRNDERAEAIAKAREEKAKEGRT